MSDTKEDTGSTKALLSVNDLGFDVEPDLSLFTEVAMRRFSARSQSYSFDRSNSATVTFNSGATLIDTKRSSLQFSLDASVDVKILTGRMLNSVQPTNGTTGVVPLLSNPHAVRMLVDNPLAFFQTLTLTSAAGTTIWRQNQCGHIAEIVKTLGSRYQCKTVSREGQDGKVHASEDMYDELSGNDTVIKPHVVSKTKQLAGQFDLSEPDGHLAHQKYLEGDITDFNAVTALVKNTWYPGQTVRFSVKHTFSIPLYQLGGVFVNRLLPSQLMSGARLEMNFSNLHEALSVTIDNSLSWEGNAGISSVQTIGQTDSGGNLQAPSEKILGLGLISGQRNTIDDGSLIKRTMVRNEDLQCTTVSAEMKDMQLVCCCLSVSPGIQRVLDREASSGNMKLSFPSWAVSYHEIPTTEATGVLKGSSLHIPISVSAQNATRVVSKIHTSNPSFNPNRNTLKSLPPVVSQYEFRLGTYRYGGSEVRARENGDESDFYPLVRQQLAMARQGHTGIKKDEVLPRKFVSWYRSTKGTVGKFGPEISQVPCNSKFLMVADLTRGSRRTDSGMSINASRALTLEIQGMLSGQSPFSAKSTTDIPLAGKTTAMGTSSFNFDQWATVPASISADDIVTLRRDYYENEATRVMTAVEHQNYLTCLLTSQVVKS